MEEPGEDGAVHYQISITGRQAAGFFVFLLAALGLAFFFGMRTGAAAHRAPDAVTRLAQASDIPVPTVLPEQKPEKSAIAPTAEGAEKPLGFEGGPAPGVSGPPQKSTAVPVIATRATEPATAAPVKAAVRPTPTAASRGAAAKTRRTSVQLAALSAEKADELARRVKAAGYRTDVSAVPGKNGVFRVRAGPFSDRAKAEAALAALRAKRLADKHSYVTP